MFSRIKKLSRSINKKFILTTVLFAGPVICLAFIATSCGSWDKTVTGPNAGVIMTATAMGFTPTFTPTGTITPQVSCPNPPTIVLNTAGNYTILAETQISDVPSSNVTGNVGLFPNTGAAIGLSCAEVTGTIFEEDTGYTGTGRLCGNTQYAALNTAVNDMGNAYTQANGIANCATNLNAGIIGGLTLSRGKYYWSSGVTIPTDLHLDAEGDATASWVMQVSGNLVMASGVTIHLDNGALAQNVVWTCAGAVSIGTNSDFQGTILCQTAINVNTNATVTGRLLAQSAVNLEQNVITP